MDVGTNMRISAVLLLAQLVAVMGCGSSTDQPPPPAGDPPDPSAQWPTLISADWTVAAGADTYVCARHTVQEDLYVAGFAATSLLGTHHAGLTLGVPDAPDGMSECRFDTTFAVTVFGGSAGTKPLEFPPGVATKIPAGAQLLLNIHLNNTSAEEQSGSYGVRFRTIPESEVVERAEFFAVGTQRVQLPARSTTTSTGFCTIRNDITLVAVAPHMHSLGIHEKVFAETSSGELTLLDTPFAFGEQNYRLLEPLPLTNGDKLRVECTHENTTDAVVTNGPTSNNEMCMATFYRYPAGGVAGCFDN
jgi:hypothetical protein